MCPAVLLQSICAKTQDASSKPFNQLHQIGAQKLDQLIDPQNTSDLSPESLKTVTRFQKIYHFPIQKNQFLVRA